MYRDNKSNSILIPFTVYVYIYICALVYLHYTDIRSKLKTLEHTHPHINIISYPSIGFFNDLPMKSWMIGKAGHVELLGVKFPAINGICH